MEGEIVKLLNSSPKDRDNLRNLISDYFCWDKTDDNDSDSFENVDCSDEDAEPRPTRTDSHQSPVAE